MTADDDGQIIAMGNFELGEAADCSVEQEAQIQDVITALDGADRWVFLDPSFILRDFRSNTVIIATLAS